MVGQISEVKLILLNRLLTHTELQSKSESFQNFIVVMNLNISKWL